MCLEKKIHDKLCLAEKPREKERAYKKKKDVMGYGSSKEFQMVVRLEKLSHKTSNPELDYNTAGQIQIHQPTLKNK